MVAAIAVGIAAAGLAGRSALQGSPTAGGRTSPQSSRPTQAASPSPALSPPPLTISSIFDNPPDLRGIDPGRIITMVVTGDVIPARKTNQEMLSRHDFLWPFRATTDYLHSGDLLFINLESPLVAACPVTETGFKFCGDPRFIDGLTFAGVGVANLSNNHLTNYGSQGSQSTIKLLTDHNIEPCGLGLISRTTIKGVRFAFLGFNGIGVQINRAELKREIDLARPTADVVVVQFHWGKEYVLVPQAGAGIAPDDPRQIGRLTIDDGADLVIGNHPHAVQGVEIYKDKLITYAHGNFVFDQMWTPDPGQEDPRNGVVGKYVFVDGKLAGVSYRPIRIFEFGQPRFLEGAEAEAVMARMRLSTQRLAGA